MQQFAYECSTKSNDLLCNTIITSLESATVPTNVAKYGTTMIILI